MAKKVIIIGAGAAGLMAAGTAAQRGHDVTVLEKNHRIGKKLLISGKGRCNITNNTDIEGLISNTPGNGNFLYSAFYTFSNEDLINFFNTHGVPTKVERGGRVFPESDQAKDVVDALYRYAKDAGVGFQLNCPVDKIISNHQHVSGVKLQDGKTCHADSVILCTGGASYKGTGSTGDGYKMAKEIGHTIAPLKPSLVPLMTEEPWVKDLMGVSLKNISVTFRNKNSKKLYEDFGEMLFTHFGVSGPVILSSSRHLLTMDFKDIILSIDLKPALSFETLDERVTRDFSKYSRKQFCNAMDDLLPQKLIDVIVKLSGISPHKFVNQITKDERRKIVSLLKDLQLTIIGARPIEEAIVTVGGINVDEINPSTMESKLIEGLYFAGEVIDIDGYTGGFNLTIAFSTGYLAGLSC